MSAQLSFLEQSAHRGRTIPRTMPHVGPALVRDPAKDVAELLEEWGKAHDCCRRAECYARKLALQDSPQAKHELLHQQELREHHARRMARVAATLTGMCR